MTLLSEAPEAAPERKTKAAEMADRIREQILRLEIPEGAQLGQDRLAHQFGVSRIPVREALMQLEGEGLIRQQAHRGYTVTVLTIGEIVEEFDLRALIETDLLRRAMPHISAATLETAHRVLDVYDQKLASAETERDWGRLNWELHSTLLAPADRPRSLRLLHNLHRSSDRYLRLQLKLTRDSRPRARSEHRRLVELCEARDTAAATRLLNDHIINARDDLVRFLAERRSDAS